MESVLQLAVIPKFSSNWNDIVMMREACSVILRSVGKLMSEGGQVNALRSLSDGYLSLWASGNEATRPEKAVLICVLNEVSAILLDVRSAAYTIQEILYESLLSLLSHSSESVNIALTWSFKCFCCSFPQFLSKLLAKLLPVLERDSSGLTGDKVDRLKKFSFVGSTIAGLVSVTTHHPYCVSFEFLGRIFNLSNALLKIPSSPVLVNVLQTKTETAWTLIAALVGIGPSFVQAHISQIMMLWKTVLTKSVCFSNCLISC